MSDSDTTTSELGFEIEASNKPEQPESWAIDYTAYGQKIDRGLEEAFESSPTLENAKRLSRDYIKAVFATLKPGASVVINSSTGKDSSLLTALYIEAALEWRDAGHRVPETIIAIADTAAEFPLMAKRIGHQQKYLEKYCQKQELPISVRVERARAKHRLLAEIIGNGRPLPALASGEAKNKSGTANSNWCMDRVKGGPLDAINSYVKKSTRHYIQMVGVRYGESAARDIKVTRYSTGLPSGLTRIGGVSKKKNSQDCEIKFNSKARLGAIPIFKWPTHLVEQYLRLEVAPWNPADTDELATIYYTASSKSDQNASECALTLSEDGGVTNKCSGFDGARLGCWCCVKSTNKSLRNMARNDSRSLKTEGMSTAKAKHRWLRGFHKYLIGLHARYENATSKNKVTGRLSGRKVKIDSVVKSLGKDTNVLFCKNINFEERARLLLLLFRAELESGFTLIEQDELDMIELYWKKAGVHHIKVEEIREDARRWKATGKPVLSYLSFAEMMHRTDVGHGIASAAYFHTEDLAQNNGFQSLNLLNLLPLRSNGTPLMPVARAYIFERRERSHDEGLVMVTDMPSVLGAKTNTGLLNGLAPFAWKLRGTRDLTEWEKAMFRSGRNFFYSHLQEETREVINAYLKSSEEDFVQENRTYQELRKAGEISAYGGFFPHTNPIKLLNPSMYDTVMQNVTSAQHCGLDSEPMEAAHAMNSSAVSLRGCISFKELKALFPVISELASISDESEILADELAHKIEGFCEGKWDMLEELKDQDSEEMKEQKKFFRQGLNDIANRDHLIQRTQEDAQLHQDLLGIVISAVKAGKLNGALIGKIAYIARMERYDPEYAEKDTVELLKLLDLLPEAKVAPFSVENAA